MPLDRPPRVGLVLGAGGITGIAWLLGALRAIERRTGWDPSTADVITGTSAGAIAAAVVATGSDPNRLLTYAEDQDALDASIAAATAGAPEPPPGIALPGSLALAATGLLARSPVKRVSSLVGVLPAGRRRTDEIRGLTREVVAGGWPEDRALWLHACDYASGALVTFGREGAPEASLADAVVASCAVPAYYRPVPIGERRYVDGGLASFTNADALVGRGLDLVLVLAPFSGRARGPLADVALFGAARHATAVQVRREVAALRRDGARVALVEPVAEDLRAMGLNPMDRRRSRATLDTAKRTVARRVPAELAALREPVAA